MKNGCKKVGWTLLIASALLFGLLGTGAGAAEKVQYGGTFTFTDYYPMIDPITADAADWNWKHGYDSGYFMEHLMMGDLQKGPRGTKQWSFQTSGVYMPPEVMRGELAERWEVKKNPLQIIFHLRKGVMWQEKPGVMKAREFVADDVVYALNRTKASRKAIPLYMTFVDRIEAKDKYTVIMHLNEWNAEWYYYIGYGYYDAIQAQEQDKAPGGAAKWQNATGTGPYILDEYKSGHSLVFKKNPDYWDKEIIDKKEYKFPFVDRAVMMLMKDESTRLTALRTAKLDMMLTLNWRQMKEMKKTTPELIWSKFPTINVGYLSLRMDRKPFDDVRVRRAVNMAIDRKVLIDTFEGGEAEIHNFPFPKMFKDVYTPFEQLPPSAQEVFTYNPEKAKKLLAEAGYPKGFSFKCLYGGSTSDVIDYLSMMSAMLAKVGVTMEIELLDYSSALSKMTKKIHDHSYYLLTDAGTPLVMVRKSFMTGQTWNPSMMSDPYIDNTWKKLNTDPKITAKERNAELKKMGVYLIEQAPGIFMPGGFGYTARWPWVKNYYGELRVGAHRMGPVIARIWIDQELKKKMGY